MADDLEVTRRRELEASVAEKLGFTIDQRGIRTVRLMGDPYEYEATASEIKLWNALLAAEEQIRTLERERDESAEETRGALVALANARNAAEDRAISAEQLNRELAEQLAGVLEFYDAKGYAEAEQIRALLARVKGEKL